MRFSLRLGNEVLLLRPDDFRLWAHALDSGPITELESWATVNVAEGAQALRSLLDGGLLCELDDECQDFLARHRLVPRGVGLGNSAERPDVFEIGSEELSPKCSIDALVYSVWAASDGCLSLAAACERTAQPLGLSLERVAHRVAEVLPALLSAAAAYVDACPGSA